MIIVIANDPKNALLGTFEGSIHSAIKAIINTPRQIAGIATQSKEAVKSSTIHNSKQTTNSIKAISNSPIFIKLKVVVFNEQVSQ